MELENPLPRACVLLVALLPAIGLAGRGLARRALSRRAWQLAAAPGLALALWLIAVHGIAWVSGRFMAGLVGGSLAIALLGAAALLRPGPAAGDEAHPGAAALITGALGAGLVAAIAVRFTIFDDAFFTGHPYMIASLQNGAYPPRYANFPEHIVRYHQGFDLLCAALTAMFRLPIDQAMRVATILLWPYAWLLSWVVGEALLGSRWWGGVAAFVTLFGAGVPLGLGCEGAVGLAQRLLGQCLIDGLAPNPPLIAYWFQHAWAVGLPLGLIAILVLQDRGSGAALAWAVLFAALSIAQVVLFLTLVPAIGLAELLRGRARSALPAIGCAAIYALVLSPFALPALDPDTPRVVLVAGIAASLPGSLAWHAASFGLALPLGIAGLAVLPRERAFFAALLAGSLIAINTLKYAHSWDAVKLATCASLALGFLSAAAMQALHRRLPRPIAGATTAALALILGASGLAWAGTLALDPDSAPRPLFVRQIPRLLPDDAAAVAWLRTRVRPGELVYRAQPASLRWAAWGGLPQPWGDAYTQHHGFPWALMERRRALLATWPEPAAPYREQGFHWFALGPEDERLRGIVASWIASGDAIRRERFGRLELFELSPGRI